MPFLLVDVTEEIAFLNQAKEMIILQAMGAEF